MYTIGTKTRGKGESVGRRASFYFNRAEKKTVAYGGKKLVSVQRETWVGLNRNEAREVMSSR